MMFQNKLRHITKHVLIAVCAGDEQVLKHADIERVTDHCMAYVATVPPLFRFVFSTMLLILEYAVPPIMLKLRPFSKLSLAQQMKVIENWHHSRFYGKRMGIKLLTLVCLSNLYAERSLLLTLGFKEAMEARENHRLRPEIAAIERQLFGAPKRSIDQKQEEA